MEQRAAIRVHTQVRMITNHIPLSMLGVGETHQGCHAVRHSSSTSTPGEHKTTVIDYESTNYYYYT